MEDIIIIGGGPAGLTAAIYVQRAGKQCLVIEAGAFGGQIVTTSNVANYPGIKSFAGADFALELYNQAKDFGASFKSAKVVGIDFDGDVKIVKTDKGDFQAKAVIVATGASSRPLGLENENKFLGMGVSYCATCDGAFYKGKDVAVVGGGNAAIEDALYLADVCKKVYLIHRRNEFRAAETVVQALKEKSNVEFVLEANVTAIEGEKSLEKIEVTKLNGEKLTLEISGLFVAVGQVPSNNAFSNVLKLDKMGYVIAGEDCKTDTAGIFVAGDCRTKTLRQLVTAEGDGAVAAIAAVAYLNSLKQGEKL